MTLCLYLVPFLRYSASNNGVTLKSGLEVVRSSWQWRRSTYYRESKFINFFYLLARWRWCNRRTAHGASSFRSKQKKCTSSSRSSSSSSSSSKHFDWLKYNTGNVIYKIVYNHNRDFRCVHYTGALYRTVSKLIFYIQWPWVTSDPHFKVTIIFNVQ